MALLLLILGYALLAAVLMVAGAVLLGPAAIGYGIAQSRGARAGLWVGILALAVLVTASIAGWLPTWYWTVVFFASLGFAWQQRRRRAERQAAEKAALLAQVQRDMQSRRDAGTPRFIDRLDAIENRIRRRA